MHILGYSWRGGSPSIKAFEDGKVEFIQLMGMEMKWKIGKRKCIGYWNGKYVPCPTGETVRGTRCESCQKMDRFFYCIKCDGSKCLNPARRDECASEEYVIYITVFGKILKVGISQEFRKATRWLEQGADFAAEVRYVKDGMLARRMESAISRRLGIADRVRGNEKLAQLMADPNESLSRLRSAIDILNGFGKPVVIHDLRDRYGMENVRGMPEPVHPAEGREIEGKVIAVKGNMMLYESPDGLKCMNLHRLAGREVWLI